MHLLSTLVICLFLSSEYIVQDTRCAGCWLMFPCKALKKIKDSSYEPQFYCKHCAKVMQNDLFIVLSKFSQHNFVGDI